MNSQEQSEHASYQTPCGLVLERTSQVVESHDNAHMRALARALDRQRGILLACTFEYPGRYRRRELGFVDPPVVLESQGDSFSLSALNARGEPLLSALMPALADSPDLQLLAVAPRRLDGTVTRTDAKVSEEARTLRPSILSVVRVLRRALRLDREPLLGLYGALGYDLVFQFEALQRRHARGAARELVLYLPDELYLHDPAREQTIRHRYDFRFAGQSSHELPRGGAAHPFVSRAATLAGSDHAAGEFEREVERAKAAFARGDLFEVTLSQTFRRPFEGLPSRLFAQLQRENPAPYGFFANLGHGEFLIGASPEMYVRVSGSRVETCPIAGTIARGQDALGDEAQIRSLLNSEKEEAELTMCTDVDRNDKARICEPGSVKVIGRRQIELYSRLIHTVDHVEGRLREGFDALDALLTHMWAVTVTGAPKLDAMQFIEDHEQSPRAFYAGAVGALHFDGSLDTGLTLRTIHLRDGAAEVRAGATLLYDSDPQAEQRESELKASALLGVLDRMRSPGSTPSRSEAPPRRATRAALPVLLIDHRDSFVHTLADYFRQAGCAVTTLRHGFDDSAYQRLSPELVVLSPGPMRPSDFAMSQTLHTLMQLGLPVFGVCLGLQGMVEFAGGTLEQLTTPAHGKGSRIRILGEAPLFDGLPRELTVGRYHSLHAARATLPDTLTVLAEHEADGCIMALAHRELPWTAVQFHPESILSAQQALGLSLIENVVSLASGAGGRRRLPPGPPARSA
ncbi:MAG: trpE [Myxococcaceae bacterium]|nr:trpE [Myxococcaceae bacterium]